MANKNIPPSWVNRDLSAKPNWNNQNLPQNREIAKASSVQVSPWDDVNREKVVLEDSKSELSNEEIAATDEIISTGVEADESTCEQESAKRSNKLIIITVVVLAILIVLLCVLAALYFNGNTTKEQGDSVSIDSTDISEETTNEITTTTISTTPTTTSTEAVTTTTTATSTEAVTTTTTIIEATPNESFPDDSIGYWHDTDYGYTRELTILQVDDDTVTFTLWYLDMDIIENVIADRNGDTAAFSAEDVEGSISFKDGIITLIITQSKRAYMPAEIMTFNARHDHSWLYDGYDFNDDGNDYSGIVYVYDADVTVYDSPGNESNAIGTLEAGSYYTIVDGYYDTEMFCQYLKLEAYEGWINWDHANVVYYYVYCPSCGYYFSPSDCSVSEVHCPCCGNYWIDDYLG